MCKTGSTTYYNIIVLLPQLLGKSLAKKNTGESSVTKVPITSSPVSYIIINAISPIFTTTILITKITTWCMTEFDDNVIEIDSDGEHLPVCASPRCTVCGDGEPNF